MVRVHQSLTNVFAVGAITGNLFRIKCQLLFRRVRGTTYMACLLTFVTSPGVDTGRGSVAHSRSRSSKAIPQEVSVRKTKILPVGLTWPNDLGHCICSSRLWAK